MATFGGRVWGCVRADLKMDGLRWVKEAANFWSDQGPVPFLLITARNLLSRPPHRKRSERGWASEFEIKDLSLFTSPEAEQLDVILVTHLERFKFLFGCEFHIGDLRLFKTLRFLGLADKIFGERVEVAKHVFSPGKEAKK